MLANYKLLKVWGSIENRKQTIAAELCYFIYKHLRLGVGAEKIDFEDKYNIEGNYHSTVGYFKLVTSFKELNNEKNRGASFYIAHQLCAPFRCSSVDYKMS
jgi:hypothetical protein